VWWVGKWVGGRGSAIHLQEHHAGLELWLLLWLWDMPSCSQQCPAWLDSLRRSVSLPLSHHSPGHPTPHQLHNCLSAHSPACRRLWRGPSRGRRATALPLPMSTSTSAIAAWLLRPLAARQRRRMRGGLVGVARYFWEWRMGWPGLVLAWVIMAAEVLLSALHWAVPVSHLHAVC
jgi:hypothetical protein